MMVKKMINFSEQAQASVNKSSNQYLIWSLLGIAFIVISLYMSIRFIINFRRSIKKTKELLANDLKIKYVQGFNLKGNATTNYILTNIFYVSIAIMAAILLAKVMKNPDTKLSYEAFFIAILGFSVASMIISNILVLVIYLKSFNQIQYKNSNKNLSIALNQLKEEEKYNSEYPAEIKLDIKKMEENNPLAPRVLANFVSFYNKMESKTLTKRYKEYLNQLFKIKFFLESLNVIEEQKEEEAKILGMVSQSNSDKELNKVEKEIAWMNKMDQKVKIIKETDDMPKMSKKEFNKKYEEYLYTVRSQDPMYQQVQKNAWLTYRDGDIEDLFYNPTSLVIYTLDNGTTVLEKEISEFLKEYKNILKSKFLQTL